MLLSNSIELLTISSSKKTTKLHLKIKRDSPRSGVYSIYAGQCALQGVYATRLKLSTKLSSVTGVNIIYSTFAAPAEGLSISLPKF